MRSSPSIDGSGREPTPGRKAPGDSARPSWILDLDDPRCTDPLVAGPKGAWLARARQLGLPVLPGVVIAADQSINALALGADVLVRRGSGGARLEVSQSEPAEQWLGQVGQAVVGLGSRLAVRSSSVLEGTGEWAGAFSSYVDIYPEEIARAIAGCWASNFNKATLERFEQTGHQPASAPMAILIQPSLSPAFGGIARIEPADVLIVACKGSPAPVVQGWEPGVRATVSADGAIRGEEAAAMLGADLIGEVAGAMNTAHRALGATGCEWAFDGHTVLLLQLHNQGVKGSSSPVAPPSPRLDNPRALALASLTARYPGPLGESLVLGWAVGDPSLAAVESSPAPIDPITALERSVKLAAALTARTWGMAEAMATARAAAVLRQIRGIHPGEALAHLEELAAPDPFQAGELMSLLAAVRCGADRVADPGRPAPFWRLTLAQLRSFLTDGAPPAPHRFGADRWEPFQSTVARTFGTELRGQPASPGLGTGRICLISHPDQVVSFAPRDVIVAPQPIPNLAPLLWDAAGLVTIAGGPGAHLFEAARSLKVPAVCGLESPGPLPESTAAAVDGDNGLVHAVAW